MTEAREVKEMRRAAILLVEQSTFRLQYYTNCNLIAGSDNYSIQFISLKQKEDFIDAWIARLDA